MNKLSELDNNSIIYVVYPGKGAATMSRKDFLSDGYSSGCEIYATEKEVFKFDLDSVIEDICEDGYDDMNQDILSSLDRDIVNLFVEHINRVFAEHPIYYKGEPIDIDIR